ncbi:type VI secretion system tube protein TssD [Rubrivirga sp. IMCC45206]|uniref:type VI secretion system tube protein TssD n=1 Tax=Rubrivirga sp. IMCC45206 TaxID=3391614 RepID=UPI00398FD39B
MPTPIYMSINDNGVAGSVEIAGREETIEIIEVEHDVHIPTDIHSGRSSGVRQHGRFTVRAAIDKATPYLYKAVTEGETYDTVKFSFFQIDDTGTEVEYYTILLERVKVAAVKLDVPNVKNVEKEHYPHMVEYGFVYGKITWTWTDGTLEHTDDWVAAR